jgi:hypothetical protein
MDRAVSGRAISDMNDLSAPAGIVSGIRVTDCTTLNDLTRIWDYTGGSRGGVNSGDIP